MFIADMSGKLITSYTYNECVRVIEAHCEIKKVIIAKSQTKEAATANLRKQILSDMRHGYQTVLNISTMVALWTDYGLTPFFDYDKC